MSIGAGPFWLGFPPIRVAYARTLSLSVGKVVSVVMAPDTLVLVSLSIIVRRMLTNHS